MLSNTKLLSVPYCSVKIVTIFSYYINHKIFTRNIKRSFYAEILCRYISLTRIVFFTTQDDGMCITKLLCDAMSFPYQRFPNSFSLILRQNGKRS